MGLSHDKRFHFHDGASAGDLRELKEKIERLSYDEFYRFVSATENHFANWIEHVLYHVALANRLRHVTSIVETVELLDEAIQPSEEHEQDLQSRIETLLFSPASQTVTEDDLVAMTDELHTNAPEEPQPSSFADFTQTEEPQLPSRAEVEHGGRVSGLCVTGTEPPHTPIISHMQKPVIAPQEKFLNWDILKGFLLGLIAGFILARVLALLV